MKKIFIFILFAFTGASALQGVKPPVFDTICQGDSYSAYGCVLKPDKTTSYLIKVTDNNGTDALLHVLHLTVIPMDTGKISDIVCYGADYTKNGFNISAVTANGVYYKKGQGYRGCDSITRLTLTVHPKPSAGKYFDTVCYGSDYYGHGFKISAATASNVYSHVNKDRNGCDSTTELTLTVYPKQDTLRFSDTVCYGDDYFGHDFNIIGAAKSKVYYNIYKNRNGCDSVTELTLTVRPKPRAIEYFDTACYGTTYTKYGFNIPAFVSSMYFSEGKDRNGCDSITKLILTVRPPLSVAEYFDTVCYGTNYTKYGFNIIAAETGNVYSHVDKNRNGCDSTTKLTLTVYPKQDTVRFSDTVCYGGDYFGHDFNIIANVASKVYYNNYKNRNGCDSTTELTLTVCPKPSAVKYFDTACYGTTYTKYGFNIPAFVSSTYVNEGIDRNGCDSMTKLILTVRPPLSAVEYFDTVCYGANYTAHGFNIISVDTGGVYYNRDKNINDCDSTTKLTLYVRPQSVFSIDTTLCGPVSYKDMFFNITEAKDSIYKTSFVSDVSGCDVTVELKIHINADAAYTKWIYDTLCYGETYSSNGFTESMSGVYTHPYKNICNMDSAVILSLTILPQTNTLTIFDTIYLGDTCNNNGFRETAAGTYSRNEKTRNGCDSLVILELYVIVCPNVNTVVTDTVICYGSVFTYNNTEYTSTTTITDTTRSILGCDSIYRIINLTVLPEIPKTDLGVIALCDGQTYNFNGRELSKTGIYYDTLPSALSGCDSVVMLSVVITVNKDTVRENATICYGEVYNNFGFNESASGTYYVMMDCVKGVSVVVLELNLTVLPLPNVSELSDTFTATKTETVYSDNGFVIVNPETKTYYRHEQTAEYGCDSVVSLSLTVLYDTAAAPVDSIYLDDIIIDGGIFPLAPEFNDSVYDYLVLLPCPPVRQEIDISVAEHKGVEVTYSGAAGSDGVVVIRDNEAGDHTAIITVYNAAGLRTYRITFRQRLSDDLLQHLWNDMIVINLNPDNNGGYTFTEFQWYLNGNALDGATDRHLFQRGGLFNNGYYHVILNTITGKTLETCPYLYTELHDRMYVHPNPVARGAILTLETGDAVSSGLAEFAKTSETALLYDIYGRLLKTYTLQKDQHVLHIPIQMPQGTYMLKVGDNVRKFVVIK